MGRDYTLDDFRAHLGTIHPGRRDSFIDLAALSGGGPEAALTRSRAIIDAMTAAERAAPNRIDEPAKQRIAAAVGGEPRDVEQLLELFGTVRAEMRRLAEMTFWQRLKLVLGIGRRRPG